jgi:hypothetical protein
MAAIMVAMAATGAMDRSIDPSKIMNVCPKPITSKVALWDNNPSKFAGSRNLGLPMLMRITNTTSVAMGITSTQVFVFR